MKRGEPAAAAQTDSFVEPTSVTVHESGAAWSAEATCAASCAMGAATTARSDPASASSGDAAASSSAPRSTAVASVSGSGS